MGKTKKVIGLMKDELGGKIMEDFVELGPKCYAQLMTNGWVDKKAKGVKKCVTKIYLKLNDYFECLLEKIKNIQE